MHAVAVLAEKYPSAMKAEKIAGIFDISKAHLLKALQKLANEGILTSERGPSGGYALAVRPREIKLKDVFVLMQDAPGGCLCLLGKKQCPRGECIIEGIVSDTVKEFRKMLNKNFEEIAKGKKITGRK